MTITEEMIEIGKLILTQDNRITADPIFLVQELKRTYGVSEDYADNFVWIDKNDLEQVDKAKAATLEAAYRSYERVEKGFRRVGYIERWDYVQPFFTEKAANEYIVRNGHRHEGKLRTYADSMYRNTEMKRVRNYLAALAK